ncbi:type VI secretion system tube protein TssD [uncultured Shewanella sp.]|uniref:type VI secretion system tube protein TssD n=1 Tax=uncultured Shewanella sp. TaxID=173975 RepID=UPI00260E1148|nr:type VI secretion system tube protein TssD [uncultured Shewanella sp.]
MKNTTDFATVVGSVSGVVKGGSTQSGDGKADTIVVLKEEHEMTRAPDNTSSISLGNQKHGAFSIFKVRDCASPLLIKMFTTNELITSVTIDTYQQTGDQASNKVYTLLLENARISAISLVPEDYTDSSGQHVSRTLERVDIVYTKMTNTSVPGNLETAYDSTAG